MLRKHPFVFIVGFVLLLVGAFFAYKHFTTDKRFITYEVNPHRQHLAFFWHDDLDSNLLNIGNLRDYLKAKNKKLMFAINGGMYTPEFDPVGLYVENQIVKHPIDTSGMTEDNFHLLPNGIFYLTTRNEPKICMTEKFPGTLGVKYATQSGPMLLYNGHIHWAFREHSTNFNIRNGVGILPNGNILFVQSQEKVNFYTFANFFKEKGCRDALFLDGAICRFYDPKQHFEQTDGVLGVMIGVTEPEN